MGNLPGTALMVDYPGRFVAIRSFPPVATAQLQAEVACCGGNASRASVISTPLATAACSVLTLPARAAGRPALAGISRD
jgi:hypothetical protein